ncbi:MAG TPA: ATP-binding protein [Methylomirabilota bacterium]|nr:ATP-binding protein [Methylomirabilota bacterium]
MRPRRRPFAHYLTAVLITAVAIIGRVLIDPLWGTAAPFVLLYPAAVASAFIGGRGPGLLSVVLGTIAANYLWLEPHGSLKIATVADGALLLAFLVMATAMVLLTAALGRARAQVSALLDASPVGLGFHDASLRYIRVNRALAEINGRAAEDHVGRTGREILGDTAADAVKPILEEVLRTGRAMHVPTLRTQLATADAERWYSVAYAPVRDPAGRVAGVAVSVSDVTRAQQAQELLAHERELLRTVIDSIPVMITMYEPGPRVLRLNREFERATGWGAAEADAGELMALCYPDPGYRAHVRKYLEAPSPGWHDLQITTRDGRVLDTSWSIVRLSDDSRIGIGLDVTDRKRFEAEMRSARAAAETANRAKDEFIAMLGHELRNPLSAIAGAVGVLHRLGLEDAAALHARDVIARQTEHLARLMEDLLDVGRVMTGKIVLDRRPLELLEAARRVETTIRATGRAGHHRLSVAGTPTWIAGDVTRIEQIITNLVTNALKYTPADGAISVSVGDEGRDAVLRVSDSGHGIPAELLPRIFDLFVQGEQAAERAQGGLGIGLTLVRRLVELHGGQVEASSGGLNAGSTFTISFPRLPAPPLPPEPPVQRHVRRQRALVIEDNDDARDMLRTLLSLDGHTVYEAANGIAGLAAALEHRPEVAIVDIGLPEMDGYEVARRLRASESLKAIKLIALTGYGQPDDARRAREAGFDLYVVKPVDPERLAEALASAVSGGHSGLAAPPNTLA